MSHSYGYEIKSKQIRKYEQNDVFSVRRAISVNAQEYLSYEGIEEKNPISLKSIFASVATTGLGIAIFVMKGTLHQNPILAVASIGTFFTLLICIHIHNSAQQSHSVIFSGTGKILTNADSRPKDYILALKGQKLRVHLHMENFSHKIKLAAEVVAGASLFSPPRVVRSVEKTMSYGKYFGSTGFFYPPALKEDIDSLLMQLSKSS